MKIGVIGNGVVGRATARAWLEHADEVMVYDAVKERRTHALGELLNEAGIVFVCLPTPSTGDRGQLSTEAIDGLFSYVAESPSARNVNFVLRSTVPIGTTRRLAEEYGLPNLVHSPEFLTARCAAVDAMLPARNAIGVPNGKQSPWPEDGIGRTIYDLYAKRFPGVETHCLTSDESEFVKLATNSFFAVKLGYFNEARTLADKLDLDWELVLGAILADGRIAHAHTRVPGPDGAFGYGGTCLPKDLASLIATIDANGLHSAVTSAAYDRNVEDRKRVVA